MPAALEELLAPDYLADLPSRSMEELRAMRLACQEVETGLSLLRRVVQGHLDIVGVEQARRAEGGALGDRADLLARLPEVLADRTQGSGPGRLSALMVPEALDPELEAELEALVGEGAALDPSSIDDAGLQTLGDQLTAFEARLSGHRRGLFGALDAVEAEIARRYRAGDASVDTLLT
jgi:hypothetical protein